MKREHYVYALFRPDGMPFYVGMGQGDRIDHHLHRRSRGRSHRESLIRHIVARAGDLPRAKIRTDLTACEAGEIERALVGALGRFPDGPLLNQLPGGEGPHNLSAEVLAARNAKISATARAAADARGRNPPKPRADPQETRQKRRDAAILARADPEKGARIVGAIRAAVGTPEARAANAERTSAYWATRDQKARAEHGRQMTAVLAAPAVKAKMRASSKRRWANPEERERYVEIGRRAAEARWGPKRRVCHAL